MEVSTELKVTCTGILGRGCSTTITVTVPLFTGRTRKGQARDHYRIGTVDLDEVLAALGWKDNVHGYTVCPKCLSKGNF